jgi:6-phosphogluconolactonase
VREAGKRIRDLPWPLDVVVLGMGEDAHTASLFPGAPGFARAIATDERLAWVVPDTAPHARISFTLSALLAARERVLCIAGEKKIAVYRRAAEAAEPALPISLVLHQDDAPISVWIA